ncbi:MAG TPA: alpha/beta hydrolase [Streptosporangiaceae bacterium]
MGLITDVHGTAEGYEAVALPLLLEEPSGTHGLDGAVLRRRSARPTKRAVIYLHCMSDSFVPADLASWYTERGFHFYVADLRRLGDPARPPAETQAEELGEYLACLDTAVRHVRDADGIETVVLCAHATGAIIAALWCHARRASQPADALVMASPSFGSGSWVARTVGRRVTVPSRRTPPLLTVARRRVRRGLDISCPVLVLCPSEDWDAPGGTGGLLAIPVAGRKTTIRLGAHVTWLRLDGAQPGQALPGGAARKRVFDELARWLSAYLSSQIRDQLL